MIVLNLLVLCTLTRCYFALNILRVDFSGIISASILQPSDSYQWIIAPANPTASSIQLVFQTMVLRSAAINIYDTSAISSAPLYSCVLCLDVMPPAFYSASGSVTVSIIGVSGAGFLTSSFSLQYISQPTLRTSGLSNITIALNSGYGKIVPQLIGGVLISKSIQRWRVKQPTNSFLTFSFSKFSFGPICSATLRIFDNFIGGNLVYSGCLQFDVPMNWIYSYTGKALVLLTGGNYDQEIDFKITFSSDAELYKCGSIQQPDVLNDKSMIISDGSYSLNDMRRSQSCVWQITPETLGSVTLFFTFISLKIGSSVVVYDNYIAQGNILYNAVISVKDSSYALIVPPPITSSGTSLYVVYTTNNFPSTTFKGFKGVYQSNYASSNGIGNGQTILSMSSAFDILPPGTGLYYTQGVNYTWSVQPLYSTGGVTFVFSQLMLLNTTDVLTIYDGNLILPSNILAQYSNTLQTPHKWVTTKSSSATVLFTSTSTSITSRTQKSLGNANFAGNFKFSYFSNGPSYHCGFTVNPAVLTASSMVISDGSAVGIQRREFI